MSYHLGSIAPPTPHDERAAGTGEPSGGRVRLLVRGIASSALVLVVMAAFAGGVWFAHFAGRRHGGTAGNVPLIRADSHPMKVRPAAPGGMMIPDQHMLVYGERHDRVEHLLPPPEAPMPRPVLPPPPAPKPQAAPVPAPPVQAVSVPPAPPVPAPAPAGPVPMLAKAPPAPPITPGAPAKPAPAPLRPVIARTGGIRLQLGSVRTPDEARSQWQHLKEANADLLGNIDGFAMRVDLGAKGIYYRIETAPLADPAVAAQICGELKRRGDGCILDH